MTNAAMVCFDALENLSIVVMKRASLFTDLTSIFMSFFQNLLGSVTTLISIYTSISNAITANNYVTVF